MDKTTSRVYANRRNMRIEIVGDVIRLGQLTMTSNAAAQLLGISANTLRMWRMKGLGPKYLKVDDTDKSTVLYTVWDVQEWVNERLAAGEVKLNA